MSLVLVILEILVITLATFLYKRFKFSTKRKVGFILLIILIMILIFALFRFCMSFFVFSSPEEAVLASSYTSLKIDKQIEVDDGAFLICSQRVLFGSSSSSQELHTILKRGNSWSALDINNSSGGFLLLKGSSLNNEVVTEDGKQVTGSGLYVYNSEMDKSMLQLDFFVRPFDKDRKDFEVKDNAYNDFIFYDDYDSVNQIYHSYLIINGEINDNFKVYINGTEAVIDLY